MRNRRARALLLERIYEVFRLTCPLCGREMRPEGSTLGVRPGGSTLGVRIIAFITDAVAARDILAHWGEATTPPRAFRRLVRKVRETRETMLGEGPRPP